MENVNNQVKYNNLSDGLREIVRKALPKNGQTIWFRSLRPNGRGTTVLNTDRIFDPYAGKKLEGGKYEGAFIDIAYITGQVPGKGDQFGRIQFTRAQRNMLGFTGGNRSDERLFTYLFLSNSLANNKDKPWFVSNSGRAFVCTMLEPALTASQKQDRRRDITRAFTEIDNMGDGELRQFASGLELKGVDAFTDPEVIREKLGDIAEKDPKKILTLRGDEHVKMAAMIKDAETFNIVRFNSKLNVWQWPESEDTICIVPPEKQPRMAFVQYLTSAKGSEAKRFIENLVQDKATKKKAKDKTDSKVKEKKVTV